MKPDSSHFETLAVRSQAERSQYREHSVPLFLSSGFTFRDAEHMRALFAEEEEGNIYSRFSNPNTTELTEKMCLLEGAEDGFCFATGMAAVFSTMMALLRQGDHIVSYKSVFGSTHTLFTKILPEYGITTTYAESADPAEWEALITPATRILYAETPTNPALEIIDLEALGNLAEKKGLVLVIDNCFATPYLQKPLDFGAHLSIHSATKFIDGQGRVLGGITVGDKELVKKIRTFSRHAGPAMSPFNAWILSKSLETLAVRMDRHCSNAETLAAFLAGHPQVERVIYPGRKDHPSHSVALKQMKNGGAMVSFVLKGTWEKGKEFLDRLRMISVSANLGDSRTIATHPASTTHSKLSEEERARTGILPGLVRVSPGLEHSDDIIADIDQALGK